MNVFSKLKGWFDSGNRKDLLLDHVCRGDVDYIKTVDQKLLLKVRDKDGNTVLLIATKRGNLDLCKEILKKCPSLLYHENNYNKKTVLHEAIAPLVRENFLFIDFFVSTGLDQIAQSNEEGDLYRKFKRWLKMQDLNSDTALVIAARYGNLHVVKRFVEVDRQYHFGLSKVDGDGGKTALRCAVENEDQEMVKLLTDVVDPYSDFVPYSTAMDLFNRVRTGDLDHIKKVELNVLLNSRNQYRISVLCMATIHNQSDCCNEILARCPSLLYHQNSDKRSVLHHAAEQKNYKLIDIFVSAGLQAVETEGGTESMKRFKNWINLQNSDGNTALIIAVSCHSHDIVKKFAFIDSQYKLGLSKIVGKRKVTALELAMFLKDDEMIKVLNTQEPLQTGNHSGSGVASKGNISTLVSKQNNWNDKVYDGTNFLGDHPGGSEGLLKATAKDATTDFKKAHSNSSNVAIMHFDANEMIETLNGSRDPNLDYGANIDDGNFPISIAMQTGNTTSTGVASEGNTYTFAEVSKHNNLKDCWLLINNKVYDVTKFLDDHPGGNEVLLKASGKDATADFKEVHNHSDNAVTMMDKLYVGVCDSITNSLRELAVYKLQSYSWVQLKDFTKDFSEEIGSGGFGKVYKGHFPQFPDDEFIAVKVLKNIEGKENVMNEQFKSEVQTMGRTYHRNLIKLYGFCYEPDRKFKALVYDYLENGSFDRILFKKKLDIPWEKLHDIAKQIAQGISYLHESCSPQIIHQDIKPSNVLLDSKLSPKIIDFGLAKVINIEESKFEQSKIKGSCAYMAPEVNQHQKVKLSSKLDVFSFGMILFDILGSKRNYVDNEWFPGQVWKMYKEEGQLEKFILDCGIKEEDKKNAERLATIALLCVEHDPQKRQKMSNVVKMLEGEIIQLQTPVVPFYPSYSYQSESNPEIDSRDN